MGSNLCDEGDAVMFGSSFGKPIPGCPSPIQKTLLARHYARRGRKPVKRSLNQKFSGIYTCIPPSEAIVIDPGGKRKGVEVAGENLTGKKQKLLETDLSAESAEQARRGP